MNLYRYALELVVCVCLSLVIINSLFWGKDSSLLFLIAILAAVLIVDDKVPDRREQKMTQKKLDFAD